MTNMYEVPNRHESSGISIPDIFMATFSAPNSSPNMTEDNMIQRVLGAMEAAYIMWIVGE